MISKNQWLSFLVICILVFSSCAKRGRPSGGPIDEDAPIYVTANPPYKTINFDKKKIKIEFNEYITLKDLTKQLVVSPPLKNIPIITPQGTPSKYLEIELMDTLLENSTYIFDFGRSIQDNNEGNQLEKFKYVFSTGDYIDSLSFKGQVADAFDSKTEKNIKLLLFKADSTYNDSLIYLQKPNYVSSTLDTTLFEFTNLSPGDYHLFALQDKNSDYLFDPRFDKIGFYDSIISLPEDSIVSSPIPLFKEDLPYQFLRAKEDVKGKILIAYVGQADSILVKPLSETSESFLSISKFEPQKDTLNYWFHDYEKDSIVLLVKSKTSIDTANVKLRKKQLDSLTVNLSLKTYLEFNDSLLFRSNNPIVKIDTNRIRFFDKDTLKVEFRSFISKKENKVGLLFKKDFDQKYSLQLDPSAFVDIYGFTNDTIKAKFSTRKLEDYGDIILDIQNKENKNLIIQLITEKDQLVLQRKVTRSEKVTFSHLRPTKLKVRIIHDANKNGRWDTGNYLKGVLPEKILYYPKIFEVRVNWSLNELIEINSDF